MGGELTSLDWTDLNLREGLQPSALPSGYATRIASWGESQNGGR